MTDKQQTLVYDNLKKLDLNTIISFLSMNPEEMLDALTTFGVQKNTLRHVLAYRDKSERPFINPWLVALVDELVRLGLDEKYIGLFYLASTQYNIKHIQYSVISSNQLDWYTNWPSINNDGITHVNGSELYDHYQYDLHGEGLTLAFLMTKGATYGYEWGGESEQNHAHIVCTSGNAPFSQNAIFRWNSGNDYPAVLKDEDKQSTTGSYVINIKGCDLYYRHGNVTLNKKDVIARSYAKFNPALMTYQTLKNPSNGTMKFYATFDGRVTTREADKIHEIFERYKTLL